MITDNTIRAASLGVTASRSRAKAAGKRCSGVCLIALAAVALAFAGCASDDGPRTTQTRAIADFTRIDNRDSGDVRLDVREPKHVRVRAGEKVIDDVHTQVRDGTLRLTFDHDSIGDSNVLVEASVPKLTGIEVSGSGDIDADGIHAHAFDVRSAGSADITLQGTVERLAIDLDGSGSADLAGLAAGEPRVAVGGSGDVDVRADERLAITIDGSGDVRCHGNPTLT